MSSAPGRRPASAPSVTSTGSLPSLASLAPSAHHLPVRRYVTPETFAELAARGRQMGFGNVASGPLVRSSYHADLQAAGHAVA